MMPADRNLPKGVHSGLPSDPLAAIVAQAAKGKKETGETERAARRLSGGSATVILADVSGSMDESAGRRRKIDLLRDALGEVLPGLGGDVHLISFGSYPSEIDLNLPHRSPTYRYLLPEPDGGTALHLALDRAAERRPGRTLVISDGHPDDAAAALAAADRTSGTIDVLYIGPDGDREAIAFMRRLARAGGGRVVTHDLLRLQLAPAAPIRALLALPPRKDR